MAGASAMRLEGCSIVSQLTMSAAPTARRSGLAAPVCVAVHAVFAQTAFEDLRAVGAADIVSCDTIEHPSNRIALAPAIAASVRELLP